MLNQNFGTRETGLLFSALAQLFRGGVGEGFDASSALSPTIELDRKLQGILHRAGLTFEEYRDWAEIYRDTYTISPKNFVGNPKEIIRIAMACIEEEGGNREEAVRKAREVADKMLESKARGSDDTPEHPTDVGRQDAMSAHPNAPTALGVGASSNRASRTSGMRARPTELEAFSNIE